MDERVTADAVRALIASLVLQSESGSRRDAASDGSAPQHDRVGGFTLRPVQRRTLIDVRAAIAEFGGALLADPPGTGKTVLALAAAHGAARVVVFAPSALRAQWLSAAKRADVPIAFVSTEALGRGASPAAADFVIIDEAHHFRTPSTRRYAHAAAVCVSARVLLLSATPVVNRAADRDALLALFIGARAPRLTRAELGRVIVRRQEQTGSRPTLRRIGAITVRSELEGVADALRRLPPPLPLAGGAPATALIVMTLAMAWQSSLAALDAALRRRIQRGDAIADLLRAGRAPSHATLRHWVLHDDATQLALPLLVSSAAQRTPNEPMLAALERHLAAVHALRDRIRSSRAADADRRADALRLLLASHAGRRVVVFARHAETVRALYSSLRGEPGVVAIIGSRVRAASGRWSREEVLRAIGPGAGAYGPRDPRAVRLLLTTDALAEGVEMQGVSVVVHADLPWTPARLEQRTGRVIRVGSSTREVLEAWFAAPRGARALVRLGARLSRKARLRRAAVRDGGARGEIVTILEGWVESDCVAAIHSGAQDASVESAPAERAPGVPEGERSANVVTQRDGFISLTDDPRGPRLICGFLEGRRWRVSSAPQHVLAALRLADPVVPSATARCAAWRPPVSRESAATPGTVPAITAPRVRQLLARVLARRSTLGIALSGAGASERRVQRIHARLARLLERAPALARCALAERHQALIRVLASPLETGRESRIDDLLRAELDDATFARRLGALLRDRVDRDASERSERGAHPVAHTIAHPAPLLLLRRASVPPATPEAAPPSASPENAATR